MEKPTCDEKLKTGTNKEIKWHTNLKCASEIIYKVLYSDEFIDNTYNFETLRNCLWQLSSVINNLENE